MQTLKAIPIKGTITTSQSNDNPSTLQITEPMKKLFSIVIPSILTLKRFNLRQVEQYHRLLRQIEDRNENFTKMLYNMNGQEFNRVQRFFKRCAYFRYELEIVEEESL